MRVLLAAVLLAAACVGFGSCSGFDYCDHRGWVKGTVIQTHSWPLPDVTAAEVRNHGDWTTFGMHPSCYDVGAQRMHSTPTGSDYWNLCYWNPTQNGTRFRRCEADIHDVIDWWNAKDTDGYFTGGGNDYAVWTTIYDSSETPAKFACSIHGDGLPSGSRFVCSYHRDF